MKRLIFEIFCGKYMDDDEEFDKVFREVITYGLAMLAGVGAVFGALHGLTLLCRHFGL
jgi:hypothetical protein